MARRYVKISLATKLRVLFSAAVLGIIATTLVVPWYFMELLAAQGLQKPGAELTRLFLNEYHLWHWVSEKPNNRLSTLYTAGEADAGRKGPVMVRLTGTDKDFDKLDDPARDALRAFRRNPDQRLALLASEDEKGREVYRCFRPVRIEPICADCHARRRHVRSQTGQLVGMIDVTMPAAMPSGPLVWKTRAAFLIGVVLAGLLAFFLFAVITHRLILRPVRQLRDLADKVAEGDLTVRSTIQTRDELQHLGESFNEMLAAIADQHDQLRAANRALDQRLNELAQANVTLYEANRVKSEFLASISHELRTPLNSIIGFADLLGEVSDERIQRYGRNIATSAKNLLGMINDLLDLAKIEAGKADVRFDKVSVADLCRTLGALMKPLADKRQIELSVELADELPLVATDAGKLQQVLYNLLSNAVKFTPAGGGVTLSAATESISRRGKAIDHVVVSVADTGPGIAEVDQERIFEKFYQADRSLTKTSYGTGLGLAIARELTGLLGGQLTLNSSPGHGAVFSVKIPVEPVAPEAKVAADGEDAGSS